MWENSSCLRSSYAPQFTFEGLSITSCDMIEQYLRIFVNMRQDDWAEWLACAEFSLNNRVNSSTGFSPFFINYGLDPRRPLQPQREPDSRVPKANNFAAKMDALRKDASAALTLAAEAMKRGYDAHHRAAPAFSRGDLVLIDATDIKSTRPAKKIDFKRHGPFAVLEKIGLQSYRIDLPNSWSIHNVFHVSKLVAYTPPAFSMQQPNLIAPDVLPTPGPPAVTHVLNHRALRNGTQYLICLENSQQEDAFWDVAENLHDPNSVIVSYNTAHDL